MTLTRRTGALLVVIGLVSVAGAALGVLRYVEKRRALAAAALLPIASEETPLAAAYDGWARAAEAGDAVALRRLLDALRRCSRIEAQRRGAEREGDVLNPRTVRGALTQVLPGRENAARAARVRGPFYAAEVAADNGYCDGVTSEQVATLHRWRFQWAMTGDAKAALSFARGDHLLEYQSDPRGAAEHWKANRDAALDRASALGEARAAAALIIKKP